MASRELTGCEFITRTIFSYNHADSQAHHEFDKGELPQESSRCQLASQREVPEWFFKVYIALKWQHICGEPKLLPPGSYLFQKTEEESSELKEKSTHLIGQWGEVNQINQQIASQRPM